MAEYTSAYTGAQIDANLALAGTALQAADMAATVSLAASSIQPNTTSDIAMSGDSTSVNRLSIAGTLTNSTSLYGAMAITTEHKGSGTGSVQVMGVTPTITPAGASQSNIHTVRSNTTIKSTVLVTTVNNYIGSGNTDATTSGNITTWNIYQGTTITKNGSGTIGTVNVFNATLTISTAFTNYNVVTASNLAAGVSGRATYLNGGLNTTGVEDRWNLYLTGTAHNHIAGNVLIGGTTDDGEKLRVVGTIKQSVYTVATLPVGTTPAGTRAFVSDANATTFASIVAAGGANFVPVYHDGTNWRIG